MPKSLIIDGKPVDPKSQHHIEHGGTVLIRTPAGGGYGRPAKRSQDRNAADRSDGYVT
jgi:N-methylhydantoinase B